MRLILIIFLTSAICSCAFQGPQWRIGGADEEQAKVNQQLAAAVNDHAKRIQYLFCKAEPEREDCKEKE